MPDRVASDFASSALETIGRESLGVAGRRVVAAGKRAPAMIGMLILCERIWSRYLMRTDRPGAAISDSIPAHRVP